jgi:hypothetical protein
MTSEEVDGFLATRRHVALAMLDATGAPDITIVPSRFEGGRLVVEVDQHVRAAIDRDPRVCGAAEVCPAYYELRGVSVHGRATPHASGDVVIIADRVMSFDFSKIRERP